MKLYLVGIEYDDFCDGGFLVCGIYTTKEYAKQLLETNSLYVCKEAKLGEYYESSVNFLDNVCL